MIKTICERSDVIKDITGGNVLLILFRFTKCQLKVLGQQLVECTHGSYTSLLCTYVRPSGASRDILLELVFS